MQVTAKSTKTANDKVAGLREQIRTLEQRLARLEQIEEQLHSITEAALDAIIMMSEEGKISFWNTAAEEIFGYSRSEVLGRHLHRLLAPSKYRERYRKGIESFQRSGRGPMIGRILELTAVRKDGHIFPIGLSLSAIRIGNRWNAIGILRDITEREKAQESLRQAHDHLEKRVAQRTAELQEANQKLFEANTALKILLQKSSEASASIEEKISSNIYDLVMPYIDELALKLDRNQKAYLDIIKNGLEQITSAFVQNLSRNFRNLTPREIQIADLIRQGHTSKQIAELLTVSKHTVDTYRASLRKKLDLCNERINLKVYLQSLKK